MSGVSFLTIEKAGGRLPWEAAPPARSPLKGGSSSLAERERFGHDAEDFSGVHEAADLLGVRPHGGHD